MSRALHKCQCGSLMHHGAQVCKQCHDGNRPNLYPHVLYVRVNDEIMNAVDQLKRENNSTRSESARCLLEWGLESVQEVGHPS